MPSLYIKTSVESTLAAMSTDFPAIKAETKAKSNLIAMKIGEPGEVCCGLMKVGAQRVSSLSVDNTPGHC